MVAVAHPLRHIPGGNTHEGVGAECNRASFHYIVSVIGPKQSMFEGWIVGLTSEDG